MSLLKLENASAFYGDFQALYEINLTVETGQVVAIVGPNGAGKSTLMKTISGWVGAEKNSIVFDNHPIGGLPPEDTVRLGVASVPEGRRLFASLSIEENLQVGQTASRDGPISLETIYAMFPALKIRRHSPATALSGGQQQMVAIGRALMSNPRLLLCDELSLGLAPVMVNEIYREFERIRTNDLGIVIVEQDVSRALKVSDYIYCLTEGRIALEGKPESLSVDKIADVYFGKSQ